jgi:hypothetical protein
MSQEEVQILTDLYLRRGIEWRYKEGLDGDSAACTFLHRRLGSTEKWHRVITSPATMFRTSFMCPECDRTSRRKIKPAIRHWLNANFPSFRENRSIDGWMHDFVLDDENYLIALNYIDSGLYGPNHSKPLQSVVDRKESFLAFRSPPAQRQQMIVEINYMEIGAVAEKLETVLQSHFPG